MKKLQKKAGQMPHLNSIFNNKITSIKNTLIDRGEKRQMSDFAKDFKPLLYNIPLKCKMK